MHIEARFTDSRKCLDEFRIDADGMLEHFDGKQRVLLAARGEVIPSAEVEIISAEIFGRLLRDRLFFSFAERYFERAGDLFGYFRLNIEDIFDEPIKPVCP